MSGTTPSTGTTPSSSGSIPSASQISAAAEANLSHAQTASSVDTNTDKPTNVTSNFTTSDTINITYDLGGNAGYITETTYDSSGTIAVQSSSPHSIAKGDTAGYIYFTGLDVGSYTTGLYWCSKSSCSDAALAQVVTFTVS